MGRASFGVNNRPIELVNSTSGGTMISSLTYTYDNVGNRTNVAELDGGRTTWSYDRTYQLTREHRYGPLSWEGLSVDQWDAMTVDGWATMEPSGAGASYNITYTYDPAGCHCWLVQQCRARYHVGYE